MVVEKENLRNIAQVTAWTVVEGLLGVLSIKVCFHFRPRGCDRHYLHTFLLSCRLFLICLLYSYLHPSMLRFVVLSWLLALWSKV